MNVENGAGQSRAPGAEFGTQVTPLVLDLADGFRKTRAGARAAELCAVEDEAAALRLSVNVEEVRIDECDGVRPGLKTAELRMVPIAARTTEKDLASKERLPPERGETPGVEIAGVDGPEPHAVRGSASWARTRARASSADLPPPSSSALRR